MPNSAKRLLLSLLLLGLSSASVADAVYHAHCAICHGNDGGGNQALDAPNLTHLSPAYMTRQITAFKAGWRTGDKPSSPATVMATAIAAIDPSTLELAVNQAAALPVAWPEPQAADDLSGRNTAPVNLKKGRDHYTAFCGSCHGTSADGNELLGAPSLLGMSSSYLARQYQAFASGLRGGKTSDRFAQQMGRLAKALPNVDQIDNVMAYVETLSLESQSMASK